MVRPLRKMVSSTISPSVFARQRAADGVVSGRWAGRRWTVIKSPPTMQLAHCQFAPFPCRRANRRDPPESRLHFLDQQAALRRQAAARPRNRPPLGHTDDAQPWAFRPAWKSSSISLARLIGMANPIPMLPPLGPRMAVLMPTTSPAESSSGPPLLPRLMAASVWIRPSSLGHSRRGWCVPAS